jgi:hypothetical protein
MDHQRSVADATGDTPHRSFWLERLARRATPHELTDYLIAQANLRGFHGAYLGQPPPLSVDPELTLEEIIVGLCVPHVRLDGRVFKLVLRILQSGRIDAGHLAWLARKERADRVLHWLLGRVPGEELNAAVATVAREFATPPRGYRPLRYDYDAARLVRRPFRKEHLWQRLRSRS